MNNGTESTSSLIISSLGWILLVVASVVFFLVAQPHYLRKGYAMGAADQRQIDMARIAQRFNIPDDSTLDAITGHITSIGTGLIVIETAEQPLNPLLDPYPTKREVLVSDSTVLKARTLKLASETRNQEPPFSEADIRFQDLQVGDEVLVTSTTEDIGYAEQFTAKEIFKNDTPTPPAA